MSNINVGELKNFIKQNADGVCFQSVDFSTESEELSSKIKQILTNMFSNLRDVEGKEIVKETVITIENTAEKLGGSVTFTLIGTGEKISVDFGVDIETTPIKNE